MTPARQFATPVVVSVIVVLVLVTGGYSLPMNLFILGLLGIIWAGAGQSWAEHRNSDRS